MDLLNHLIDLIFRESKLLLAFLVGAAAAWFVSIFTNKAYRDLARDTEKALRKKIEDYREEVKEVEGEYNRLERRIKEQNGIIGRLNETVERLKSRALTNHPRDISGSSLTPAPRPQTEPIDWGEISRRLRALGISQEVILQLQDAFAMRGIELLNSDGRMRLRIRTRNGERTPVAIIWRGVRNHRVLFPDNSDDLVPVPELSEIPN